MIAAANPSLVSAMNTELSIPMTARAKMVAIAIPRRSKSDRFKDQASLNFASSE
ncbi:hypothetical protein Rifp1Sym_ao00290 [endosymbiont of Riftia pachyptila (vent Ph05)]|uniref:Uncharacterized protein n=1 Tax=endosymbiont of Riftia pachyptila (vent Ph05) TaxID=1048808 RepID=G2DB55_9GAMM|nr:hypothetical protein Rifp1Sym_ao00290 [endosymbiont of Riftia pachyptila (vent Ph05)]